MQHRYCGAIQFPKPRWRFGGGDWAADGGLRSGPKTGDIDWIGTLFLTKCVEADNFRAIVFRRLSAIVRRRVVIVDGDILETESNVTDAFIQGRRVDLGSRHKSLYEKYRQKYQLAR